MIRKWLNFLIAYTARGMFRVLMVTCKVRIEGLDEFVQTASEGATILMLWHNRLAIAGDILYRYAPQFTYAAFISKSKDAEPLAVLAESYPQGRAIRVAHDARHQALSKAIQHIKGGEIVVITPDGPRGPRYVIKPGIMLAAKMAAASIMPFTWTADRYWEFNTWDKLRLPKPFTTIVVTFGPSLPHTATIEEMQAALPVS